MDGLFSRRELTRWRRVVHRPNGGASASRDSRTGRVAGDGEAARLSSPLALRRPSGLAAWASFWRGVVPGSVTGLLPRRPRRIGLRRSQLACARRSALPLDRCIAASVGAPVRPLRGISRRVQLGAQGRGSVRMRLAARGRRGTAGVVPGSVTGLCPSVPGRRRAAAGRRRGGRVRAARTFYGKKWRDARRSAPIESASRRKRAKMCTRNKQKRATALFLRDRPQAFPFGSSFTFPFPLAPLDGHKPAQAR